MGPFELARVAMRNVYEGGFDGFIRTGGMLIGEGSRMAGCVNSPTQNETRKELTV